MSPHRIAHFLSSLLQRLPSQCHVCRAWPSRPVCDACVARFAPQIPRCHTCALPVYGGVVTCGECVRHPPPLDRCVAVFSYVWPWPECIAQFKFRSQTGWATPFSTLLLSTPWVEPVLERCDLVLPMPLSAGRLRERGFNQAFELARRLAPGKSDATLLLRTRDTSAQSGLTRAERLQNLQGAFALEPSRAGSLTGRHVVLVDDVMTSGASLFAAASVLRTAGAAHITALVLARTDAPNAIGTP